ncbi:hypothetical protein [Kineococcus sp. SYSU DK005]|uniref:hypothetical protein n=1 Tax=Kineococcus sp. SYSU DK005 TaxID=3383126 RepID=UPI003D7D0837
MHRRAALALAAALLAAAAAGACSGRGCPGQGADPGVSFDLSLLPAANPRPWEVTACVDGVCSRRVLTEAEGAQVFVQHDALGGDPVGVDLEVHDAAGVVVVDAHARVVPREWAVNGEGCEPVVRRAWTAVDASGSLAEQPPP